MINLGLVSSFGIDYFTYFEILIETVADFLSTWTKKGPWLGRTFRVYIYAYMVKHWAPAALRGSLRGAASRDGRIFYALVVLCALGYA